MQYVPPHSPSVSVTSLSLSQPINAQPSGEWEGLVGWLRLAQRVISAQFQHEHFSLLPKY